jgi:hypothetical protein
VSSAIWMIGGCSIGPGFASVRPQGYTTIPAA